MDTLKEPVRQSWIPEITSQNRDIWNKDVEERLWTVIRDIRYGNMTLVILDGHVVQIDKNEKVRLK